MELKVKYQYTYFIKPFLIKESKYENYLFSLLSNKNYNLKIFEKEKDFNLYKYFIQSTREYFFPTFEFSREKIKDFDNMIKSLQAKKLSKLHCNIFEYSLNKDIQGKIDESEGIFFNIDKIEIICFDTGICFLIIKTNINNSEKFSDLLDFNYRFKDINSNYSKLRDFTNIKIQTDKFSNMNELSDFIDKIIGVNNNSIELKDVDLYNKRFFVYTYSCIDQDDWNIEDDFEKIQSDFLRYSNVISSNDTLDFKLNEFDKNIQIVEQFKYSRFGFAKNSATLLTSSIDINNYTKLLFEYENEYLYTLIISLYQRVYLKKLEIELKNKENLKNIRKKIAKFTKEIYINEITNSTIGTIFYNKWKEVFEFQDIYNVIKNNYEVLETDESKRINKVIRFLLLVSMLLNVLNLIKTYKQLSSLNIQDLDLQKTVLHY